MDTIGIFGVIISAAALLGTVFSYWSKSNTNLALAKQAQMFHDDRMKHLDSELEDLRITLKALEEKTESRIFHHESNSINKLDQMQKSIHNIEINIARMAKSQ